MRTVKINRAKWRSGMEGKHASGKGITELINSEGYQCCLGFASCQLSKKSKENFRNLVFPMESNLVIKPLSKRSKFGTVFDTDFTNKAVKINDNDKLTRKVRENKLIKLFAEHGINLEFYGSYVDYNEGID